MRLAFVQYGVLHQRFADLASGGEETYYAQRYSVNFVADLAEKSEFVGVIGFLGQKAEEEALNPTLRSACVPLIGQNIDYANVIKKLEEWRPDRLILQAPSREILRWALRNRVDTLPLLADSFQYRSVKRRVSALWLGWLLNSRKIRAVGNHNIPASMSLKKIGVRPSKIYPWDWPHALRPENHPPKSLPDGPAEIVFVGSLSVDKGARDCLEAAKLLKDAGADFHMTLIGDGSYSEEAKQFVLDQGLAPKVTLAGRLGHDRVVEMLAKSTISLTPSHHIYPEGLPMTIYEALATRTPLVISDHPMFKMYLADTPAAIMTPEQNPAALAKAISTLMNDAGHYARASMETGDLWNRIKCDLAWGELIDAWLDKDPATLDGLNEASLAERLKNLKAEAS